MKRSGPIQRKTRLTATPKAQARGATAAPRTGLSRTPMKRTGTPLPRTKKADGVQPLHPAGTPKRTPKRTPATPREVKPRPEREVKPRPKPGPEKVRRRAKKAEMDAILAAAQVIVRDRSGGRCERCEKWFVTEAGDVHHRRPRKSGGSMDPTINSPANLVHLCRACHAWIETNSRKGAIETGWLVPMGVTPPAEIPVVQLTGRVFFLNEEGQRRAAA